MDAEKIGVLKLYQKPMNKGDVFDSCVKRIGLVRQEFVRVVLCVCRHLDIDNIWTGIRMTLS